MDDENAGLGGSYVLGEDGVRRLVERTQEAVAEPDQVTRGKRKPSTDGGVVTVEPKDE